MRVDVTLQQRACCAGCVTRRLRHVMPGGTIIEARGRHSIQQNSAVVTPAFITPVAADASP